MEKILLDTNFLMIPAQFGVDIFSEIGKLAEFNYKLFILDKSISELNKIADEQKGKVKREVKLTLEIIEDRILKDEVRIIQTGDEIRDVDDIIVSLKGYIICTQDIGLQKRLIGKKIITMRQKKYLVLK